MCSFFFFFKQKTAYEMRISDWSSDVCSSDLQGLDADARMPLEQGVDADAEHRAHHVRGERFAHADRVGDDQVGLQLLVQRASAGRGAGQFVAQRMRAEQLVGVAAEAGGDRSEEHTSELQSLMRISYAVFCLKK